MNDDKESMIGKHTELVLQTTAKALEPQATDVPVKTRPKVAPHGRRIRLMVPRKTAQIKAGVRYGYRDTGAAL
jgi:hypothetical protein